MKILAWIFHTPELQHGYVRVGRVPSRGALLAFPAECEMSRLAARNLLATALVGVLAGMMPSLKPTGFGNP